MADELKKVIIEVKAETKQATASIRKLTAQVKTLEKQQARSNKTMRKSTTAINKVAGSFKQLSLHLARLVVIYGSFEALSSTITTFADFEQSIKTLGAVSGASGEELNALREKALELGKSTVFTASQVVGGMTEMARAGLTAQQQLDGIHAVLNLSIAGLVDLGEATKIAVTTMHGFGLKAKDMAMISDVLTASINSSSQNLDELSSALAKVAPVAHAQNVSLQETVSVLGAMANAGIRAELAGTQLKIILTRLGANNQTSKYIKELGLSMYNLRTGQLLPLMDRLKLLKNALNNLSPKSKNTYIAEIFGTRSIATANVLLGKIKQMELQTKFLKNSFGVADTQARKMMDTLLGSWKELKSALENLEILIGKNMSNNLKSLVQNATDFVRELSPKDITAFSNALSTVISTAYDFGKILANVVMVGVRLGDMLSPSGKISGGMIFLGALIYKLRARLIALLTTQPEILALIVSLGYLLQKIMDAEAELKSMKDNTKNYENALKKSNDVTVEATKLFKKYGHTLTALRKIVNLYGDSIEYSKRKLKDMGVEIAKLEKKKKNSWWGLNDLDSAKLDQFKIHYKALNDAITSEMSVRNEASKMAQKLLDKENEARGKNNQLTAKAILITDAERKAIENEIITYKNREKTARNTLDSMIIKETQYYNKLTNLERKLSKTRQDFANKRATLNANFENDIANIQASSLSKLQQYNDAQLRADKALASAKRALSQGNLTLAKNYMSIYNSLITQQTSSEIKDGKLVVKTKLQLNNELIADKKRGHQIELGILKEEENRAIKIINNQINLEKNKIKLNKVQMDIQLKILELQTKSVAVMNKGLNGKYDADIKHARDEVAKLSAEALKLTEKQRTIKINAVVNKNKLAKDVDSVGKDTTITPKVNTGDIKNKVEAVKPEIIITYKDYGVKEFEKKFGKAKKEAEKPIHSNYEVNTEKSENKITNLQQKAKKSTKSLHTVKVDDTAVIRARKYNTQNTSNVHTTYLRTVQQHATGGFIQRKGALGGYGGGDKIKALLEQGEFIVRKEAVKSLGLNRLQSINQGVIPKFATGGLVLNSQNASTTTLLRNSLNKNGEYLSNDGKNWGDLIANLRAILATNLPPVFKKIFQSILANAESQSKKYTDSKNKATQKISDATNSSTGKILSKNEYAKYKNDISIAKTKLSNIEDEGKNNISRINFNIAQTKSKMKSYLDEVDYYKQILSDKFKSISVRMPFEVEHSLDLDKLKKYIKVLSSKKFMDLDQANHYLTYKGFNYGLNNGFVERDGYGGYKMFNEKYANYFNKQLLPKFKTGGFLGGYGGGDKVLALLEDGEFILRKEAVKKFGVNFISGLNNLKLPKFKTGGAVNTINSSSLQPINRNVNINFKDQNGGVMTATADEETALQLEKYFKRYA